MYAKSEVTNLENIIRMHLFGVYVGLTLHISFPKKEHIFAYRAL
jgi:hypothetical protein